MASTYFSTRGQSGKWMFSDILLKGLAPDGGLFLPESWPHFDGDLIDGWRNCSYADLAFNILLPFIDRELGAGTFQSCLKEVYGPDSDFRDPDIVPLRQIDDSTWLMELFHGPTLAFKDVALQLLGRLFDRALDRRGQRLTIVGATSGDTGSAAIEACRHCRNVDIFILHPAGRVSDVQRRQMTTVQADNVFNLAIEGTFDDCQRLVKDMFGDQTFREEMNLGAINSINWARIMAQIVYYFSSALRLRDQPGMPSFAVPTGNFGNVYAAHAARKMGLPVGDLIIGSNRNDILTRFFETGRMEQEGVVPTLSPSMDIQISSNFERYIHDMAGGDTALLSYIMQTLKSEGAFDFGPEMHARACRDFSAASVDDEATKATIARIYSQSGVLIDPHTAVGLKAGQDRHDPATGPLVALACAHPAKFPDAVEEATGTRPALPAFLTDFHERPEQFVTLAGDLAVVQDYIRGQK